MKTMKYITGMECVSMNHPTDWSPDWQTQKMLLLIMMMIIIIIISVIIQSFIINVLTEHPLGQLQRLQKHKTKYMTSPKRRGVRNHSR